MNANLNALQRLGLMGSNNNNPSNPSQNIISQAPPKENTNSQMNRNPGISQDTQKGPAGNPFSGLRSQLQNLAARQKANNVSLQATQQANNNKESANSVSAENKLMSLFGLGSNPIVPANVSQANTIRGMGSLNVSQIQKPADDDHDMRLEPILSYNSYSIRNDLISQKNEIMSQKPVEKQMNDFIDENDLEEYAHLFDDGESGFGLKNMASQRQENVREDPILFKRSNNNNNNNNSAFPSQFEDDRMFHTQKKLKQNHDFPSDSTKYTINITGAKSSPATKANFTQFSKREVIQIEDSQTLKVGKNEMQNQQQHKRGTASPLFKLKQQNMSKNQKIVNLATNDAWKKALMHLRIDLPEQMMGLSANQAIGRALNELNFCTISQIKGNMCISLKAPNLLAAIKSFEVHKDTVTMILLDLTGEIQASIVKSVVSDDINNAIYLTSQKDMSQKKTYQHGDRVFLKTGTILWLKNVTIFTPGDDTFYLTISQNNVENVFYEQNES